MASSSGRQPNFAALNRGRHLCSAGRPSSWALAHILVANAFPLLKIGQNIVRFVSDFRYFDHVINNDVTDDNDTKREIRNTCALCIGVTL